MTNVSLYCYGDAMERRHYTGDCVVLTEQVEAFIDGRCSWDEMISDMLDVIHRNS